MFRIILFTPVIFVQIAILKAAIFRHGLTPDGMLNSTMVPKSKGRWADLYCKASGSIICTSMGVIILIKGNKLPTFYA